MMILALAAFAAFPLLLAGLWLGARGYARHQHRLDEQAIEACRDAAPRALTLDEKWDAVWEDSDAAFWATHGAFAGRDFGREDRGATMATAEWHRERKRLWLRALDTAFELIAREAVDPQARRAPSLFWRRAGEPPRLPRFGSYADLYAWHMLDHARAMGGWETEQWSEAAEQELTALLDDGEREAQGVYRRERRERALAAGGPR